LEELWILAFQVDRCLLTFDLAQDSGSTSEDIGVDGKALGRGRWLAHEDLEGVLEVVSVMYKLAVEV
jgi:hypothetical protein